MERTDAKHKQRIIGWITLNDRKIEVVITRHGDYRKNSVLRILESRNIKSQDLTDLIESIGKEELEKHFIEAGKQRNSNEKDWRIETNYTIAVYDVIDEIVIMLGIHPHLNRITVPTIIPRIKNVEIHDVFGVYRVDCEETKDDFINEIITQPLPPRPKLELKRIVLRNF